MIVWIFDHQPNSESSSIQVRVRRHYSQRGQPKPFTKLVQSGSNRKLDRIVPAQEIRLRQVHRPADDDGIDIDNLVAESEVLAETSERGGSLITSIVRIWSALLVISHAPKWTRPIS